MSASVRAVYHHNDFESDAAAYIIEISIKIWVRETLVYVDIVVAGPIVPWFAVGFVMVGVFFVWCVMRDGRTPPSTFDDVSDTELVPPISWAMVGIPPCHVAQAFQTS